MSRRVSRLSRLSRVSGLRRRHAWWLVPLVIGLSALTSCGDEAHPSAPAQAIGSGVQAGKSGPTAQLLAADKMPTAGAEWADVATSGNDAEVLGPCHLASLVDIGALSAVRRTWSADAPVPRAVQVVARFADNKSAWRAHQVLDAWQADCAERVPGSVGSRRDVRSRPAWARPTGWPTTTGPPTSGSSARASTSASSPWSAPPPTSPTTPPWPGPP